MRNRTTLGVSLAVLALIAVMAVWAFSSSDGESLDVGAANPESQAVDYDEALAGAPPELADLYADGDALLTGGPEEFDRLIEDVRGHPAVVNVWASWCGPCRQEFPFFQDVAARMGDEVAFIGINSKDGDGSAGGSADTFLDQFPVPYPSVVDQDGKLANEFDVAQLPGTVFFDANGDRTYVHYGPYTDSEQLEREIERYAQ